MRNSLDADRLSHRWFGRPHAELDEEERQVLDRTAARRPITRDTNEAFAGRLSFGDRLADRVASFGGSWTFISAFGVFLAVWAGLNLALGRGAFDPYPFIFLNLMLSMLAAIQAPIIMMSQNRQSEKDRLDAANDYQVNLKAEIEIMALHEKLDELRDRQLGAMILKQQEQIDMLTRLLTEKGR
ncbi:MAG: DUF1003 domain-containing protein [Brevundimonas sp.]|jgi:uncharacterized membrane protein|uniref:DUF1003 domain-containing protein n=1 Tax=Brevundimonas sp. TaxID=1871086 RepID=UPI002582D8CB|nr:DUF1003 domain-containing protein [Brevundimonas sp.]MCV0414769.1 DUF1003 domain-containing protein [Brevundimonas sp.]